MNSNLRILAAATGLSMCCSLASYSQISERQNAVGLTGPDEAPTLLVSAMADLAIEFHGGGVGRVVGPSFDFECSEGCARSTRQAVGETLVLQAVPMPGSVFAGWEGPEDCRDGVVTLTSDLECGVRFEMSESTPQIGIFDYYEGTFTSGQSYSNPFTEVDLSVLVTTPSGVKTVQGFYDGNGSGGQNGNVWKFRYMPIEAGPHSFVASSNDGQLNGESGSFTAVASVRKGPVAISPANPHLTIYRSGGAFVPVGETTFFILSDDFTQSSRLRYVSQVATKGVNKIILVMVNDDTNDVFPWLGTASSLDRTRFNLPRIAKWEGLIEEMRDAGIAAYLWFYSDDSRRLYPAADGAEEDLYFSYIVSRFAAYENVIWNLGLEYSEYRSRAWVESRSAYLKSEDPNHLVAVHQVPGSRFDFIGSPHLDIYSHQGGLASVEAASNLILDNQAQSAAAGRPIVVWPEEWVFDPPTSKYAQVRNVSWAITLQGGGHTIMGLNFWGSPGSLEWWNDVQDVMAQLIGRVDRYEALSEQNDLVSGGGSSPLCMANIGREYLVMRLDTSTFRLDLSDTTGSLSFEWWNLDTGQIQKGGEFNGGSVRDFTPPFAPAVLYVSKSRIFADGFESGGTSEWSP